MGHALTRSDSQLCWCSLRLRTGSAGAFVAAPRDGSERGGIKPEGLRDEDVGAQTVVTVLFLSSLYSSYPGSFHQSFPF